MIIDTSAIAAVVFKERGHEKLINQLADAGQMGIGAATLVETGIMLSARLGVDARPMLARLIQEFEITIVPFGDDHWREAVSAYVRYGRGRHKAKLNFGDCMSYATAKLAGQPLLFVGNDFSKTDIQPAQPE
jgi:ribonuclease VapC